VEGEAWRVLHNIALLNVSFTFVCGFVGHSYITASVENEFCFTFSKLHQDLTMQFS